MQEIKKRLSGFFEMITSERFFFYYIISVMIALPVMEIFDEKHSQAFASQPIIVEIAGYVGIFAIIVHFLKHQNIKYYLTDLLYLLLFVFALLSAVFTLNKQETWHGFNYDEWLFNFVGYFSLMFAGTMIHDKQMRKGILNVFILVTVIQSVVAALQTCGIYMIECYYDTDLILELKRSYGLTQHSNWYGGLSVLMFACTSGIFLFTQSKLIRNITYAISILCFYTLLSCEARLAWVGVAAYLIFLAVSLTIMKFKGLEKEKLLSILKRLLLLIVGMALVTAFVIIVCGKITGKLELTNSEISSASGEKNNVQGLGSGRVYIWKFGLKMVPEHWAFGIGLDNYKDAFLKSPDFHEGMFSNAKGHNEYIHYLVTQGVFQLITYLTLLVYAAVTGIRNVIHNDDKEERFINWIVLGMFFGYAAQALFNSSIVNVVPYFWITIGMCLSKKNQHYFGYAKEHKKAVKA
ncbi:O-antigen ligase family protein [Ruminococcus flavefaciens]|uniref:O-antigen ligase n=1 Tax=Ruminococcus flavefaciens TaxID=1265 RepID=A0A1M7J5J5_RUMFL|nr:O-antigen ligase family protein [Ruminococcus flavefaciens]SHM48266.1 O-antigen ligase [Ruminococcus flavefaciens]